MTYLNHYLSKAMNAPLAIRTRKSRAEVLFLGKPTPPVRPAVVGGQVRGEGPAHQLLRRHRMLSFPAHLSPASRTTRRRHGSSPPRENCGPTPDDTGGTAIAVARSGALHGLRDSFIRKSEWAVGIKRLPSRAPCSKDHEKDRNQKISLEASRGPERTLSTSPCRAVPHGGGCFTDVFNSHFYYSLTGERADFGLNSTSKLKLFEQIS